MKRLRLISLLVAIAVAAAFAAEASAGAQKVTVGKWAVGAKATKTPAQILRFWTKERIAKARPLKAPKGSASTVAPDRLTAAPPSLGPSVKIPAPPLGVASTTPTAPTSTTSTSTTGPVGWWNPSWGTWSMVGRLYLRKPDNNYLGWCSGTVVVSNNQSTIWTAGHCLRGAKWYTDFLFAPGQNKVGYSAPYGWWPIRQVYVSNTWYYNNYSRACTAYCAWGADYGAAIASTGYTTLAARVGSLGMWFNNNTLTGKYVLSLGYPASYPYFDRYGGALFYCNSAVSYAFQQYGLWQWHKPCGMNGGSSGGPWLRASNGYWYLVSNNSNADIVGPKAATYMNGPYLNTDAQNFYNYVQAR